MKKLFLCVFFVLIWSNVSRANDCVAIEKICLGDSALNHFSKKELKDNEYSYYDDENFITSIINSNSKFKTFETVEIDYNKADPQYKILYVNGRIFTETVKDCLVKLKEYNNLISNILNVDGKYSKKKNGTDEQGESYVTSYEFNVNNKIVTLECYDWSKRMQSKFVNNFTMSVTTKKFRDFQWGVTTTY